MIQITDDYPPQFLDGEGQVLDPPAALKQLQKDRGWKAPELARMLGVSPKTIYNWQQGEREIPLTALLLLTHLI